MRRVVIQLACSAWSAVACGSFDAAPASADAGTDADALGPPLDAARGDAAAGATFCATQSAPILCDDFEQPGRAVGPGAEAAPWDAWKTAGSLTSALGAGKDSAHAFEVTGAMSGTAESRFFKNIDIRGQRIRWSFQMRVDVLGASEAGATQLRVVSFLFEGGTYIFLVVYPAADNSLTGAVIDGIANPPVLTYFSNAPSVPPSIGGGWARFAIEYEPRSGADQFRFYEQDALVVTVDQDAVGPGAIALGPAPGSEAAEGVVAFDDVLVTTF